jgi:hypothetical protein
VRIKTQYHESANSALRALPFADYCTIIAFCNFPFDLLVAATCR